MNMNISTNSFGYLYFSVIMFNIKFHNQYHFSQPILFNIYYVEINLVSCLTTISL